jgi:hypothetical protein
MPTFQTMRPPAIFRTVKCRITTGLPWVVHKSSYQIASNIRPPKNAPFTLELELD